MKASQYLTSPSLASQDTGELSCGARTRIRVRGGPPTAAVAAERRARLQDLLKHARRARVGGQVQQPDVERAQAAQVARERPQHVRARLGQLCGERAARGRACAVLQQPLQDARVAWPPPGRPPSGPRSGPRAGVPLFMRAHGAWCQAGGHGSGAGPACAPGPLGPRPRTRHERGPELAVAVARGLPLRLLRGHHRGVPVHAHAPLVACAERSQSRCGHTGAGSAAGASPAA